MVRGVEALVEPDLLVWARESLHLSVAEAADSVGVTEEALLAWEKGDARPTVAKARELARIYKRPLAVFYLPERPKDFAALRDFRLLPGEGGAPSTPLSLAIREAQQRRETAVELADLLGEELPRFTEHAELKTAPEELAPRLREVLGVTAAAQFAWVAGTYQAYHGWRSALEGVGILVFTVSGVDVEEMRGLSVYHEVLPVVAVNARDSTNGRCFSMLHEMAHLLLRSGGSCDFRERRSSSTNQRIEVWCNQVAGETLVPRRLLLAEPVVTTHTRMEPSWTARELSELASRFCVSEEVIVRRLLSLDLTTQEFYNAKRQEYAARAKRRKKEPEGGPTQDTRAVARLGRPFVRLVLRAFHGDAISASDVSQYLGVKLRHLAGIEAKALGGGK